MRYDDSPAFSRERTEEPFAATLFAKLAIIVDGCSRWRDGFDSRSQFCAVPERFVGVGAGQLGAAPSSLNAGCNYRNLFARAREPSQAAGAMLIGKVWARGAIGCSADHLSFIL